MKLISIDIENFLSIEQAHVDFDDSGMLLLEGWNYDVDRANGAGKTAILNAISFALYDKIPRKITASEILRRGAKRCTVLLRLDSGSEILEVRRSRPKGVEFYRCVNGTFETIKITQEEWEQKLRLNYNQFVVSVYCSQANSAASPRFLLLNDSEKKQFLLQLLKLDEFILCKKKVDEKIQTLLLSQLELQNKIAQLQTQIDAYSESLIDENHIKLVIAQKEAAKATFLKVLKDSQAIVKPDLAKYYKLEEDILSKKTEFTQLRTKRDMLAVQWNSLSRKIRPFNAATSCPTCGSDLDNSHAESVHSVEMEKLKKEQVSIKQQMDDFDAILLNESKIADLYVKLKERKRKETAEYDRASISQAENTIRLNSFESQIIDLNKKLDENAKLAERVNNLKNEKNVFFKNLHTLSKDLEIQQTVAAIYSPIGAQAYVLDSAVALFNEQITKYISILWSNLTYELQSYKETVKGDVTAKFSESIVMDGRPISLGSLSGGELKALSICTDMALLGILEQQFGIHVSPVIFDEAFDGLDASGKEFTLELIRELSQDRQVIVIDHASEMRTAFDKILRVEKRNGISTISVNTI